MNDDDGLKLAFDAAYAGVAEGQGPFGAAIVRDSDDKCLAACCNVTAGNNDVTQHAELRCIQLACAMVGSPDLSGCTIYATCEPCPMCFGAIHWARLGWLVSSATIEDAAGFGMRQMPIDNATMARLGKSEVRIRNAVDRARGRALFEHWQANKD